MLDSRFSMRSFDGLLATTEMAVEKMIDGDISAREADIVLKAVSTARAVLEAKKKQAPSSVKNPVAGLQKDMSVGPSGPFGVFSVVGSK